MNNSSEYQLFGYTQLNGQAVPLQTIQVDNSH